MKRVLIVMALTLLVALAVAGPAVAFATTPPDGAWIFPWDGGSWGTVVDGQQTDVWNPPGTPIPAGMDVWMGGGWLGYTRGLIKNIPNELIYKVTDVADPDHPITLMTYAQGKTYWSVQYAMAPEDYEVYVPFNPNLGAKLYGRDWWVPLGKPAAGEYDWVLTEKFRHTTTDLCGAYFEGQHHPYMYRAVPTDYPFTIVVQ